ncbi:MAG TPA: hypothetical protein VF306_04440 [Pirellulales bacterium]
MAVAVALERDIPGVDSPLFSEPLFAEMDRMNEMAEAAGARLLASFIGTAPAQSLGFEDDELQQPATPVEWFDATEGLRSVEAILKAVRERSADYDDDVLADLDQVRRLLESAREAGVRFNLEIVL